MTDQKPTNSEIEVLTILWKAGASTARQVHNEISKNKPVGYTSTLKTIQNMYEKELLEREPQGQTHLYRATVSQEEIQKVMLGGFVNKLFNGSAKNLILQALGNQKPSREELDEIREMLDKLANDGS